MRLRKFMQSPVYACSPTATLSMAAREMEAHNVGSLVVTNDEEKIVGIITDRDLALCLAHGRTAATTVAEIMSHNVVTIPDDADTHDAAGGHGRPGGAPPAGGRRAGTGHRHDLPR